MFTGIINSVGTIVNIKNQDEQKSKIISVYLDPTDAADSQFNIGESIAINGTCLTLTSYSSREHTLDFFLSPETLIRTTLGSLKPGCKINIERALRLSDRISGHLVQGHVDGFGKIKKINKIGEAIELCISVPTNIIKYATVKGSIALDGISLTINYIENSDIYLMIIPHTWQSTHLPTKSIGDDLNIEVDMIAKYLDQYLERALELRK